MNCLPNVLLTHTLSYFDDQSILKIRQTAKRYRSAVNEQVWKTVSQNCWGHFLEAFQGSWEKRFYQCMRLKTGQFQTAIQKPRGEGTLFPIFQLPNGIHEIKFVVLGKIQVINWQTNEVVNVDADYSADSVLSPTYLAEMTHGGVYHWRENRKLATIPALHMRGTLQLFNDRWLTAQNWDTDQLDIYDLTTLQRITGYRLQRFDSFPMGVTDHFLIVSNQNLCEAINLNDGTRQQLQNDPEVGCYAMDGSRIASIGKSTGKVRIWNDYRQISLPPSQEFNLIQRRRVLSLYNLDTKYFKFTGNFLFHLSPIKPHREIGKVMIDVYDIKGQKPLYGKEYERGGLGRPQLSDQGLLVKVRPWKSNGIDAYWTVNDEEEILTFNFTATAPQHTNSIRSRLSSLIQRIIELAKKLFKRLLKLFKDTFIGDI